MGPQPPQPPNAEVFQYMPPQHVAAFQKAAGRFQVWILVRRGNSESLKWIGKPGDPASAR